MKKHIKTILIVTACVLVFVFGYFAYLYIRIYSVHGNLEKKGSLTIKRLQGELSLDVNAPYWQDIEPVEVHLLPQSARSPYGNTEKDILVKGVYNDEEVAFLLDFPDPQEDRRGPTNPDLCAVLFTPRDASAVAQMMGFANRANIWQWRAELDTQRYIRGDMSINAAREPTAGGPGTQTPMSEQNVVGKGEYSNGRWKVMFKRKLTAEQKEALDFKEELDIAFAVWEGSQMESSSRKSISVLRELIMGE